MEPRVEVTDQVCPVCTLFLRPGITLKQHLTSHPKQKVIDALVKLSIHEELQKSQHSQPQLNQGISHGTNNYFKIVLHCHVWMALVDTFYKKKFALTLIKYSFLNYPVYCN